MKKYVPVAFETNLGMDGVVFDVGSLFEAPLTLHDQRDARGLHNALSCASSSGLRQVVAGEDWRRAGAVQAETSLSTPADSEMQRR